MSRMDVNKLQTIFCGYNATIKIAFITADQRQNLVFYITCVESGKICIMTFLSYIKRTVLCYFLLEYTIVSFRKQGTNIRDLK